MQNALRASHYPNKNPWFRCDYCNPTSKLLFSERSCFIGLLVLLQKRNYPTRRQKSRLFQGNSGLHGSAPLFFMLRMIVCGKHWAVTVDVIEIYLSLFESEFRLLLIPIWSTECASCHLPWMEHAPTDRLNTSQFTSDIATIGLNSSTTAESNLSGNVYPPVHWYTSFTNRSMKKPLPNMSSYKTGWSAPPLCNLRKN